MRGMLVILNDSGRLTYPIYFLDPNSGEVLHVVRMGHAGYIKELMRLTGNSSRIVKMESIRSAEHSAAPSGNRIFIKTLRPGVVIVDTRSFEKIHEPYLPSWLLWMEPRLLRWFERLGGASELIGRHLDDVDGAASWVPNGWVRWLAEGGGGFVDDRFVLVGAFDEVRLYDLRDGLVAREENPHFLRRVMEQLLGVSRGLGPVGVSSVRVPPNIFSFARSIVRRDPRWFGRVNVAFPACIVPRPIRGDRRYFVGMFHNVCLLGDSFFALCDYREADFAVWESGFSEDGWPLAPHLFLRRLLEEDISVLEDLVGGRITDFNTYIITGTCSNWAVDPRGRFFVFGADVPWEAIIGGKEKWGETFAVLWFDLRSGRFLRAEFGPAKAGRIMNFGVLGDGSVVVSTLNGVFVFDSSFRLRRMYDISRLRYGGKWYKEMCARMGISGYVGRVDHGCVSPDLRLLAVPFHRSWRDFEGGLRDATGLQYGPICLLLLRDEYFGLSERVRRELRTLYVAFLNFDGELEYYFGFRDDEERMICPMAGSYWF